MTRLKQNYIVTESDGDTRNMELVGRYAWAMNQLINAGSKGCTPIDNPAPRWSAYIHLLRKDYLIDIETIDEAHGGLFAGTHARYVLRSVVQEASESEAANDN